ncbi:MAG: hypothetical protein JNK87_06200 [Bryobacterales bacterium]|nr:hypothetical protein [Bryobacterales bacterium]
MARWLLAISGGVLLYFGSGLQPVWWLAWLAPAPVLLAMLQSSRRQAVAVALLAAVIGSANLWSYLAMLAGPLLASILTLEQSLLWAGAWIFSAHVMVHTAGWRAALVYPAAITALFTLMTQASPHGSAGSIAYSQMDVLPVIQIASLLGASGVVFVISLLPATLAAGLHHRKACLWPLVLLAAALVFGWVRLRTAPLSPAARVAAVAVDTAPEPREDVWPLYQAGVRELAEQGARFIVLPEKIAPVDAAQWRAVENTLASSAVTVAGATLRAQGQKRNVASVFGAPDTPTYDKRHMVPGLEDSFLRGDKPLILEHGGIRFGVAICKDMDFPSLGRDYAGVPLLLVPAWDFQRDAWLHSRMAILRSVESGFAMVRSARDGRLTVNDRYGRVLAEQESSASRPAKLIADVPLDNARTFYSRTGDWFGQCCFLLMMAIAVTLRPSRSGSRQKGS